MTWGPLFMYYNCPRCGMKYKYELGLLAELGERFGRCPDCDSEGIFEKEGPRTLDDDKYYEAE